MPEHGDEGAHPQTVLVVLLIISIMLIFFSSTIEERTGKQWGRQLIHSVQRFTGNTAEQIKDGFASLKRLHETRALYESALTKLGEYQGLEHDIVELRRENEELRRQLKSSGEMTFDHLPARIIGGDPSNLFSTRTIDKGTDDGIRLGMVVVAFENGFFGLLGKIVSVSRHSSQLRTIVDPNNFVAARLQRNRFEGLVEGRGNEEAELVMRHVRKAAGGVTQVNDLVVTSGMRSLYPKGIVIGRVKEVRSREYSSSLDLILIPLITLARTEYVFVLRSRP